MLREIFFLTCGEFGVPSAALVAPRDVLFSPAMMRMSNTIAIAVRESGDIVLVDAGWSLATCHDPESVLGPIRAKTLAPLVRPEHAMISQLRALGLDPSRVTSVIATHMHLDHIEGIADFPNAELVVSSRELSAFWGFPPNPGYRAKDLAKAGRIRIVPCDGPGMHGFRASFDMFGDGSVLLLDARGHTRGSVAVQLKGPSGSYLHVGDAVYQSWEYGTAPAGPSLLALTTAWDRGEQKQSYASIRTYIREEPAVTLVSSHDARVFERLPHRPTAAAVQ